MRGGICSIQLQPLTLEATTVVKQAVNLATRRGHAQVTPLHVASAMLATSTGLLRKACLQCHSHPLQFKALELCFNVELNPLPASTSSPLLAPQYSTPSLSNALVAAFKRAQAHQRRGSIENQQQHILALKIKVEQLVISILDDPSVSKVMREAGFSSTLVKTRVEQAVSMEVYSKKASSDRSHAKENITKPHHVVLGGSNNVSPSSGPFGQVTAGSFTKPNLDHVNNDDVTSVLSELVRRKNTVIVGEGVANAEGVAKEVMERFEVGNVHRDLRYVQFVSLPLMCFRNISKEEVEHKLMEIRNLVKSCVGKGVVLYLGDLKCGESSRLWLMGIATFKAYMKCKMCHPSLEAIWELHPFTIPVGSLSLSLNFHSDFQAQERSKLFFKDVAFEDRTGVRNHLTCCRDCLINFEKEAQSITNCIRKKFCPASSLPTWLQNCKEERSDIMEDQENSRLEYLCKKWNSLCNSIHRRHPSIMEFRYRPV
ncbi:Protein SMAX1-LIKE 3 [Glycine max]|nr:Protein SMAX1-LIKE 3 [Glycine max]